MLEPGALVADKYRIERVLGSGGMGHVVSAVHVQLGTKVALKFLHDQMLEHPKVVERFLREARATAQLRGEHVCRVMDVGTIGGKPYLVLELLDGTDLSRLLKKSGPVPPGLACAYVLQACAGIAEAHALGIVHRDLKPSNLFVTKRPDGSPLVKVLDFGVAKAPGNDPSPSLTQTTNVLGSPGYMSPEQLRSSKLVDARTDIWSLGAILYELVVGVPPFDADTLTELALKIGMDPTPRLPFHAPELEAVIARCLAKQPDGRYRDVGELAAALGPLAASEARDPASAVKAVLDQSGVREEEPAATVRIRPGAVPRSAEPSVEIADAAVTTLGRATGQQEEQPARSRVRRWWPVALVVAVGGAIGSVGVVGVYGGHKREPTSSPVPAVPAAAPAPAPVPAPAPAPVPAPAPAAVPVDAPPAPRPHRARHGVPKPKPAHGSAASPAEEDLGDSRI